MIKEGFLLTARWGLDFNKNEMFKYSLDSKSLFKQLECEYFLFNGNVGQVYIWDNVNKSAIDTLLRPSRNKFYGAKMYNQDRIVFNDKQEVFAYALQSRTKVWNKKFKYEIIDGVERENGY